MSKTIKAPKQEQKKRDPKYRVIPNLSLKGKDIMQRVKNRSLDIKSSTTYSLDEEFDNFRRMDKLDQVNRYNEVQKMKKDLQLKLNQNVKI